MQNIYSICFISLYFALFYSFSHKLFNNEKYNISSHLKKNSFYCCDNKKYNNLNHLLLIGDSHSYRFLVNIILNMRKNKYNVFWKYIHTLWIINNKSAFLNNINRYFHLIISMNAWPSRNNNTELIQEEGNYSKYVKYLKTKCKYLIVYKPTPTFNFPINCREEFIKR